MVYSSAADRFYSGSPLLAEGMICLCVLLVSAIVVPKARYRRVLPQQTRNTALGPEGLRRGGAVPGPADGYTAAVEDILEPGDILLHSAFDTVVDSNFVAAAVEHSNKFVVAAAAVAVGRHGEGDSSAAATAMADVAESAVEITTGAQNRNLHEQ